MLKLAFSTLPLSGWNMDKIIRYCTEFGYQAIEVRESKDFIIHADTPESELITYKEALDNAGINVSNIGSGICFIGDPNEKDALFLEEINKNLHLAQSLGARGVRVFLGNFRRRHDSPFTPIDYHGIVSSLQAACIMAQARNLEIWIETHNEFATGKALKPLIEDVGMPNCKIIWDIMHPLEDGEAPEDTLHAIGEAIVHVHIKDGLPFEDPWAHDWKYTKIGEGIIPIPDIVKQLMGRGYQGYLSLEWESKWREEIRSEDHTAEKVLPYFSEYMNKILEVVR